ncbi:MAG: VIT1/CCC1 transporter family protein [Gammaproteobacteria bacterium]
MIHSISLSLARKYLEPGESLAEILFGLIMTLIFTLGAGLLVEDGPGAVRELLIATVGCNIAWGIIDGAIYITGQIFERGRMARLGEMIRRAGTEEAAAAIVEEELDEMVGITVDADERADLYRRMARHVRTSEPRSSVVTRADLYGAIATFWLVFFASIPATLPFLFMDDAWIALRVSNGILIGLLFLTGYRWAGYTNLRPWHTGLALMAGGMIMVAIGVALGG